MFKVYEDGKFTDSLVKEYHSGSPKLLLSEPKGEGLQLNQLKPGKIIIVVGGTGLYPFSDLIDLLFKEQLGQIRPELREVILQLSPVLATVSFQRFSFHLMGAFRHPTDIHPITVEQLKFLSTYHPRFSLTLKMKGADILFPTNVKMHTGSFGNLLTKEVKEKEISQIYVCGPPKMNEELCQILKEEAEEYQYTIM